MKDLLTAALSDHLARIGGGVPAQGGFGRRVFGTAERAAAAVDLAIAEDLDRRGW